MRSFEKPKWDKTRPKVWTNNDEHYEQLKRDKVAEVRAKYGRMLADGVRVRMDLEDMTALELAKLPQPTQKTVMEVMQIKTNKKVSAAMKKAKVDRLVEDGFTFALTKCMDKNF